ncbi:hypothetical protein CVT25_005123 [Psilocybe cyanescens]|uniref:Uncharacterized protein n=1 Tax=Psilocybe cyanescens TaxID=93625 RepID=A0A409XBN0_PSICY|nr:hypothetical protein CVT25_005123 [Psilocybe cyanescens]
MIGGWQQQQQQWQGMIVTAVERYNGAAMGKRHPAAVVDVTVWQHQQGVFALIGGQQQQQQQWQGMMLLLQARGTLQQWSMLH